MAKPVRVMKPSLAHSPSWVCRLRGVIWRHSASSRPLQSRGVGGHEGGDALAAGGRPWWPGRAACGADGVCSRAWSSGGVVMVMLIAVMAVAVWGRPSSRLR